jgi:hypothetical protein
MSRATRDGRHGLAFMFAEFRVVETLAVDETELRKPHGETFDHAAHGITNTIEEQPRDRAAPFPQSG